MIKLPLYYISFRYLSSNYDVVRTIRIYEKWWNKFYNNNIY